MNSAGETISRSMDSNNRNMAGDSQTRVARESVNEGDETSRSDQLVCGAAYGGRQNTGTYSFHSDSTQDDRTDDRGHTGYDNCVEKRHGNGRHCGSTKPLEDKSDCLVPSDLPLEEGLHLNGKEHGSTAPLVDENCWLVPAAPPWEEEINVNMTAPLIDENGWLVPTAPLLEEEINVNVYNPGSSLILEDEKEENEEVTQEVSLKTLDKIGYCTKNNERAVVSDKAMLESKPQYLAEGTTTGRTTTLGDEQVYEEGLRIIQNRMSEEEMVEVCRGIISKSEDELKTNGLSKLQLDVILFTCSQFDASIYKNLKRQLKLVNRSKCKKLDTCMTFISEGFSKELHLNSKVISEFKILDPGMYFIEYDFGTDLHLTALIIQVEKNDQRNYVYFDSLAKRISGFEMPLVIYLSEGPLQKEQKTCSFFCLQMLSKVCDGAVITKNTKIQDLFEGPDYDEEVVNNFREVYVAPNWM